MPKRYEDEIISVENEILDAGGSLKAYNPLRIKIKKYGKRHLDFYPSEWMNNFDDAYEDGYRHGFADGYEIAKGLQKVRRDG